MERVNLLPLRRVSKTDVARSFVRTPVVVNCFITKAAAEDILLEIYSRFLRSNSNRAAVTPTDATHHGAE